MKNCIKSLASSLLLAALLTSAACSTAPVTDHEKDNLNADATRTLSRAKDQDPTLITFMSHAAGYAVFPSIGKGGAGLGGAYGRGILYQNGAAVGYCDLTQATIGAQLGGQSYSEIICFQTLTSVEQFKANKLSFDAQATAVAIKSGAGTNANYTNGVAVFTCCESGLMAEASVGGQGFTYSPK